MDFKLGMTWVGRNYVRYLREAVDMVFNTCPNMVDLGSVWVWVASLI